MTERDKLFCQEYMIDFDAKNAAIRAGYKASTANNASDWLGEGPRRKPQVIEEIARLRAKQSRRTGITANRIIDELAKIGFADPLSVIDPDTGRVRTDVLPEDSAAIASVRVRRGDAGKEYEVRMADKTKALELLGKHLGIFEDNVKLSGPVPVIIENDDGDDTA